MTALQLAPAQRKAHRAQAHHLDPIVMVGDAGLSPAVLKEAEAGLAAHGLIKVRVFSDRREEREALFATLCDRLGAAPIQHIGKLLVLWRPVAPKAAAEARPTARRKPGPRTVKVLEFSKSGNHRAQVRKLTVLGNERLTAGGLVKRAKKARASSAKKRAD